MLFVSEPWQAVLFWLEMTAVVGATVSAIYRWRKGDYDSFPSIGSALSGRRALGRRE